LGAAVLEEVVHESRIVALEVADPERRVMRPVVCLDIPNTPDDTLATEYDAGSFGCRRVMEAGDAPRGDYRNQAYPLLIARDVNPALQQDLITNRRVDPLTPHTRAPAGSSGSPSPAARLRRTALRASPRG